jgi:hypothetical protein
MTRSLLLLVVVAIGCDQVPEELRGPPRDITYFRDRLTMCAVQAGRGWPDRRWRKPCEEQTRAGLPEYLDVIQKGATSDSLLERTKASSLCEEALFATAAYAPSFDAEVRRRCCAIKPLPPRRCGPDAVIADVYARFVVVSHFLPDCLDQARRNWTSKTKHDDCLSTLARQVPDLLHALSQTTDATLRDHACAFARPAAEIDSRYATDVHRLCDGR